MNFTEIAKNRQSCRSYNPDKAIEDVKLEAILNSALLAPSACNCQPYKITVCRKDCAAMVAKATQGMGMNRFTSDAPIMLVISEEPYNKTAALGAKVKNNDYRSIDIGIVAAYITAEATAQGLDTCILGWFNNADIRKICNLNGTVRLVISLGYAEDGYALREKKRKNINEIVKFVE